jgi:transcriptional regulator of NAD metabolism
MKANERRKTIAAMLMSESTAISGDELSRRLSVSRQTVVQDITALKNAGYDILSTHCGYLIQRSHLLERVFKVFHSTNQTEDELCTIVDLGGTVVDVFVWHKVYGKISAPLNIFSRHTVNKFIEGVRSGKSTELMNVTGGYHYHTVRADSEEILSRIEKALSDKKYIVPEI